MRILIASDGSDCARMAAKYACQIAHAADAETTLLGVVEKPQFEKSLRSQLEALADELTREHTCPCTIKIRQGNAAEQIRAEVEEHPYHLVVVGSRGRRRFRDFLVGSTARRLVRAIKTPVLIYTGAPHAIKHILICTSGLEPGENDAFVGGTVAALLGAEVTVLHVMSQIPLTRNAQIDDLERDVPELIESGAREGRHLRRMLDILTARGLARERRRAKIRHGLVIDEIMAEASEGDYDLIVIGAHYVPEDQSWRELRELLQENIAARIIRQTQRPVLVVHSLEELEWDDL